MTVTTQNNYITLSLFPQYFVNPCTNKYKQQHVFIKAIWIMNIKAQSDYNTRITSLLQFKLLADSTLLRQQIKFFLLKSSKKNT